MLIFRLNVCMDELILYEFSCTLKAQYRISLLVVQDFKKAVTSVRELLFPLFENWIALTSADLN